MCKYMKSLIYKFRNGCKINMNQKSNKIFEKYPESLIPDNPTLLI